MRNSVLKQIALVALATAALSGADRALAQSADSRTLEDLQRENAAMSARIHRLEVQQQNTNLRARLDQLEGKRQIAESAPTPPPQTAAPISLKRELVMADMPLKAAPVALPRYYSWTGFYMGGNIGYSIGQDRASQAITIPSNGLVDTPFADAALAPRGATGGVQFGYNWQGGRNWLVGFETDFQAASQTDKACTLSCEAASGAEETLTVEHKIEYFGTVRARLGAVVDNVLFYATAGGAYGRVVQTDGLYRQFSA